MLNSLHFTVLTGVWDILDDTKFR